MQKCTRINGWLSHAKNEYTIKKLDPYNMFVEQQLRMS